MKKIIEVEKIEGGYRISLLKIKYFSDGEIEDVIIEKTIVATEAESLSSILEDLKNE